MDITAKASDPTSAGAQVRLSMGCVVVGEGSVSLISGVYCPRLSVDVHWRRRPLLGREHGDVGGGTWSYLSCRSG